MTNIYIYVPITIQIKRNISTLVLLLMVITYIAVVNVFDIGDIYDKIVNELSRLYKVEQSILDELDSDSNHRLITADTMIAELNLKCLHGNITIDGDGTFNWYAELDIITEDVKDDQSELWDMYCEDSEIIRNEGFETIGAWQDNDSCGFEVVTCDEKE